MIIYIFLIAIVLLFLLFDILDIPLRSKKLLYGVLTSFLFLIVSFRSNGYDFINYWYIFNALPLNLEIGTGLEYGFKVLCSLLTSYRMLLVAMATSVLLYAFFIWKRSPMPFLSMLILTTTFLLPMQMGQMRQGFAISIILLAYYFIDSKMKFIFLVLLASMFHISSLISLFFMFIPNKLYKLNVYIALLLLAYVFSSFMERYSSMIFSYVSMESMFYKLIYYSKNEDYSLGFNTAILIRVFIFSCGYIRRKYISYKKYDLLLNLYYCSIIFYLLFGFLPQLAGRGAYYFACFDILLIPLILMSFTKTKFVHSVFVVILLSLLRYISFFSVDYNYREYVPYIKYENML